MNLHFVPSSVYLVIHSIELYIIEKVEPISREFLETHSISRYLIHINLHRFDFWLSLLSIAGRIQTVFANGGIWCGCPVTSTRNYCLVNIFLALRKDRRAIHYPRPVTYSVSHKRVFLTSCLFIDRIGVENSTAILT